MTPALSVVIPTWNRPDMLAECLEGFVAQTVGRSDFEVVVVDDGSDHDPGDVATRFADRLDLRLERRPHRGVAAARNVGVVLARAPLLVLFDDDQRPLPDMVERCLAFHAAEPDEAAFRMLRVVPDPLRPRDAWSLAMFEGQGVFVYPAPGGNLRHGGFWGGAISCKSSIFRYGLYDSAYAMVEDVELGLRLAQVLPLACHYDGVPDAAVLRVLDIAAMARRWMRLSYHHLLWQRNQAGRVDIGTWAVYRDAETIAARVTDVAGRVATLDDEARAIGPVTLPAGPEMEARLRIFLDAVMLVLRACQARGWLAARRDEALDDLLARELP